MRKTTKLTAGQAHALAMGDSGGLLEMIREELTAQAEADRQEGIHWAHTGSAQHYRELLREALMQMRVVDDEEVTRREIEEQIASRRDGKGY